MSAKILVLRFILQCKATASHHTKNDDNQRWKPKMKPKPFFFFQDAHSCIDTLLLKVPTLWVGTIKNVKTFADATLPKNQSHIAYFPGVHSRKFRVTKYKLMPSLILCLLNIMIAETNMRQRNNFIKKCVCWEAQNISVCCWQQGGTHR